MMDGDKYLRKMRKLNAKRYLRKLDGSLHDADLVGVEFLLMWLAFAASALVLLGCESLIWRWLGG